MSLRKLFLIVLLLPLLSAPGRIYSQVSEKIPQGDGQPVVYHTLYLRRIVEEFFGGRVAERFDAVQLIINNDTGHDLIIKAVEFAPPAEDRAAELPRLPVVGAVQVAAYISNPAKLRRFYEASFRPPFVVRNNEARVTIVFIPKSFLNRKSDKSKDDFAALRKLGDPVLFGDSITCKSDLTDRETPDTPRP